MDLTLTQLEPQHDVFEPSDQLPSLQVVTIPQLHRHHHHQLAHQYSLQDPYEAEDLDRPEDLEANPILPPGKHHLRQQPNFRLKFMNLRDKFNKTSFASTNLNSKTFTQTKLDNFRQGPQSGTHRKDGQQGRQQQLDIQYLTLLQHRKEVYRRVNNSKMNRLGKDRVLCSLFFDWRKERISSKSEPLFEYLSPQRGLTAGASESDWLSFSSSFQSGNLLISLRDPLASIPTYQLYMQNDINTKGCTQWYYFSVTNHSRGKAKLKIMNFYKPTSLYQRGMKVLCSYDGIEWKRTGTAITYSKTAQDQCSYSLDFLHQFDIPNKTTYFSYGYPYTYSHNLNNLLDGILAQSKFQKLVHRSNLCLSAMGNPIPMISISNFSKRQQKPLIYIIGRQHPGETPASFIVEGLIHFLLSSSFQAKQLRQKYQFRIIPMVNVDGVISGNYRSNISGSDVNRSWQFPSKRGQPQVFWLKHEIGNNKKNVAFFLDIHAHSRKMNSFFYGSRAYDKDSKLFPFVCSKLNKFISYTDSSFTDDPSKKTTARVVLQTQFSIPHSLTFEVSFYGWIDPTKQTNYSFKQSDLRNIGESLGIGFYYSLIGIDKARKGEQAKMGVLPKCQGQKQKLVLRNCMKILQKWIKQCERQNSFKEDDNFSEGSSLDPQHFQLKEEERQFIAQVTKMQAEKKQKGSQLKRNMSNPKETIDKNSSKKKRLLIYSTLSPGDNPQSKLLTPKSKEQLDGQNLGISSNEFYHFSNSAKNSKKQPFSVRQLQLQLQLSSQRGPERKLRGIRLKMGNINISPFDRYQSLDIDKVGKNKNYKQQVLQMKKALKYLLQTKSSDYQQYKSCFKSITGDYSTGLDNRYDKKHNK